MGEKKLKPCKKSTPQRSIGMSDTEWNRLMDTVEEIKKEADKKLEEISGICLNRECK
jgi:hypothetical protein